MKTTDHPLFPAADGDEDAPEVDGIHVTRFQGGKYVYCPYLFAPEELLSLQQIYEQFGGGQYELIARCDGKMSAKRRYELDGRPRPLAIGGADEPPDQPSKPAAPVQLPAGENGMLALVMQQGQQNAQMMMQMMQLMMQSQQTASAQNTALLTAFMNRDSDANKTMLQALSTNNERALQGQAQVFQAMLETMGKGASGGGINAFKEGMAMMAELGGNDDKDDDDGTGTLKTVVEGLKVASALAGNEPPPTEEMVQ